MCCQVNLLVVLALSAPRLRVPAEAVQRDAQVQVPGHRNVFSNAIG